MTVNNEIGTIQPIREIAKAVRWARAHVTKSQYPLFHTDACQGTLFADLNVEQLGVDLLTLDGAKVYGPRGIGALFMKRNTPIEPIIYGGGQEKGLRSGTENLPAIAGFAKALEIAAGKREHERARLYDLRSHFAGEFKTIFPKSTINSDMEAGAPHILNVSIPGIDNEFFVLQLDAQGIATSTKSSCLRDADESYVLQAIGADSKISVRFSFGRGTTQRELGKALKIMRNLAIPKAF